MDLAQDTCIPCQDGGGTLTRDEQQELMTAVPLWTVVDDHHLQRRWSFADFQTALDWINRAGRICEEQGHHADFLLGWGYAAAEIHTHKVNGLTRADFVLAAKLDAIAS